MKHLILIHTDDQTSWDFSADSVGIIISDSGFIVALDQLRESVDEYARCIVCGPRTMDQAVKGWQAITADASSLWVHFGGMNSALVNRHWIENRWNQMLQGDPFSWNEWPLPYSMNTTGPSATEWDETIQNIRRVRKRANQAGMIELLRKLDQVAVKAKARYYVFEQLQLLCANLFPFCMSLASQGDSGLKDPLRHVECQNGDSRAISNVFPEFLNPGGQTSWIDWFYETLVPVLPRNDVLHVPKQDQVRRAVALLERLGSNADAANADPQEYVLGLKPLFELLQFQP